MKKFILIALLFCLTQTKAQTWVTIPDTAFVNYLHTIIPGAMNGNQMDITNPLVTTTTHAIYVSNVALTDLSGIQYFSSLDSLVCFGTSLHSLPTLPNSLLYLECEHNNSLTSLTALPNSLTYLNCTSNKHLTHLSTLPGTLTYLSCFQDSLTSLPTLPNSLLFLNCQLNYLTSLPTLPNSLTELLCDNNHLTSLPVLPNSITYLQCFTNSLTVMPTLPNALIYLVCNSNNLISLPTLPPHLIYIECEYNSLTSLPTLPDSLQTLLCNNNQITCFPTFPNTILARYYQLNTWNDFIRIDNNPFTCLPNYLPNAMEPNDLAYPLCAAGNTNGCPIAVAGISTYNTQNSTINIYPNPAQNNFTIQTSSAEKQTISIVDVNGKQVLTQTINATTNIDVSSLNAGVYNININGITNKRLVIVK